jgi:hypothetical protein
MPAVLLHPRPRPSLVTGACLIPIADWKSGRVQIGQSLRWTRRGRYLTLVRIPKDHPVRICFGVGNSNFIKALPWPSEYRPLSSWEPECIRVIGEWWDAPGWGKHEPGGLYVDEPHLFLGRQLPDSCIRWTKDRRLLYGRPAARPKRLRLED